MPELPRNSECGAPIGHSTTISGTHYPTAGEQAFLEQIRTDAFAAELAQVDALLAAQVQHQVPMQLMVANDEVAERIRQHLAELGVTHVEVKVAGPRPKCHYWTPAMAEAKVAAWDAQQPRHSSRYTHTTPPTTKARKAARRRARAGRKASR